MENIEDEDNIDNDMNKKWENIKTITKGKKQQLIEKDKSSETLKNRCYNEEWKIAKEGMKKAKKKWHIKGRR